MNEELRKMLEAMGMAKGLSDDDAMKFAEERGIKIIKTGEKPTGNQRGIDGGQIATIQVMSVASKYGREIVDEASKMLRDGKDPADIYGMILERQHKAQPTGSAELGLSTKEKRKFSFCRAILAQLERNWKLAPFEKEVSDAAAGHMRMSPQGFFVPMDVLGYNLNVKAEDVQSVRDSVGQVVGSPTDGGNTVATDLLVGDFIEMLRRNLVLSRLGVRMLTGLRGNIAIPRQTGGCAYYFVEEQGAPTLSKASFDQIAMTPKTVAAKMIYSRLFLMQSSLGVEQFIRADIARNMAEGLEYAFFLGTGLNNQPRGILNITGLNSIAIGTDGGAMTGDHIVDMETEVADDNVYDDGTMAYLTNARVRGRLKRTLEFATSGAMPLWKSTPGNRDSGDLNGYPAFASGMIPKNGTKGNGTNLSTMVHGRWSDAILALWGVMDMIVDPYSGSDNGDTKIVAFQSHDVTVRHKESFCKCTDIVTAADSESSDSGSVS